MKEYIKATHKDELFLISPEEGLEYTAKIKGKGKKITLKYSYTSAWTDLVKGKTVGTLKDTGNGIEIYLEEVGSLVRLDYDVFCNLYQLMKLKVESDPNL